MKEDVALEQTRLPEKMSALIRLAVKDAKKIARRKGYELGMGVWHSVDQRDDVCVVCMAGAVMACELGVQRDADVYPSDFLDSRIRRALNIINSARTGHTGLTDADDLIRGHYNIYLDRAPWHIYIKAADLLEEAGL